MLTTKWEHSISAHSPRGPFQSQHIKTHQTSDLAEGYTHLRLLIHALLP